MYVCQNVCMIFNTFFFCFARRRNLVQAKFLVTPVEVLWPPRTMVLILDGNSKHVVHA